MIPVLGIAYYNRPDLLARCLRSIDYKLGTLVIVDNSPEGCPFSIDHFNFNIHPAEIVTIRHPNAGWAASCNEVIKLFPKAAWWLLVNNDIQFASGDLKKMDEAAWAEVGTAGFNLDSAAALFGNHGASWWTITWRGVQRVGLLDENFYPCYLDDCDWCYRAKLAGAKTITVEGCQSVHGDDKAPGSCTIHSSEELRQKNHRTHGRLFDYYREKWGGVNEHEVYQHPFNNPNWPVQFWIYRPEFRRAQQW